MLELSRNQEVQRKLREEIRQAKSEHGLDTADSFSVEQLNAMPYLDAVMVRTLLVTRMILTVRRGRFFA